ncbi:MAG TPA: methyltransferase domain-containing protein [Vicinamibacterales bacterium]|jgi:SAM-dependent methyltransferase|nr:methyltransferase domain-containing protein [Vicinamibacterales bacterium]
METAMTAGDVRGTGYHAVHLPEDPARAVVWRVIADYLSEWIPPQSHVLEIGAGYCCWINAVRAARRVAVDTWPEFRGHAASGVETTELDASRDLGRLGAATFDVVLASNVIEHFDPDTAAGLVGSVAAALKRGGRLLVIQPNFRYAYRKYFDDYTHRSVFTDVSLPNLLRSRGFRIDRVEPRFLPYSMRGTRWPIAPWLVRAYLHSPIKPRAGQMLVIARKD